MAPAQKPGRSKQDYQTPDDVLRAIMRKLSIGQFVVDLAADENNAICGMYYTEKDDSLIKDWHTHGGWGWCNPPYSDIAQWVMKAWFEGQLGAKVAMLLPLSGGSNWWRDWVHNKAHVLMMNGRATFIGETTPYPKDTAILLYTKFCVGGYECWEWKNE